MDKKVKKTAKKGPSLISLLKPYSGLILILILLAFVSNGLDLVIPKLISKAIDSFNHGEFVINGIVLEFFGISLLILLALYLQSVVQTYASEKVAKDLREQLSTKISKQSYAYVQEVTPSKLLTNLTSDIDSVKLFVSQAIVSIVSSLFLIIGASALLISINWRLALVVLTILPLIAITFIVLFSRIGGLFRKGQEAIDWLNKVINESILGSGLIRILNSQHEEYVKFLDANSQAKSIGMSILQLFASLLPIITFISSMATLAVLALGGRFVIGSTMSLGDFAAFNSYIGILIFPIILIGFMSNVIGRASASYKRVSEVLTAPEQKPTGDVVAELTGKIEVKDVSLNYEDKPSLKNVTFSVKPKTKVAIIGPTAAGKTQLLYLLTGLTRPTTGKIFFDGKMLEEYEQESLYQQIGFVFQDSITFNLSLRENIAFSNVVKDEYLEKAVETSELKDFVDALPQKLDTVVSERGSSLSGGQKQRIMLARALALNPKILLLDDFTARVDTPTEKKIVANISKNYPDLTLISVTQKISSVEDYDNIILLMEGEVLAQGTHKELMKKSPEYVQIFNSQKSTNKYELQSK